MCDAHAHAEVLLAERYGYDVLIRALPPDMTTVAGQLDLVPTQPDQG